MEWIIAEWDDENEGRIRAPSFMSASGIWYRASADHQGPIVLRMEGEPASITQIQGSKPSRPREGADINAALCRQEVRVAALGDTLARLEDFIIQAINRVERDVARLHGRASPSDAWLNNAPSLLSPAVPLGPQKGPSPAEVYGQALLKGADPAHAHSCGGGGSHSHGVAVFTGPGTVRVFEG